MLNPAYGRGTGGDAGSDGPVKGPVYLTGDANTDGSLRLTAVDDAALGKVVIVEERKDGAWVDLGTVTNELTNRTGTLYLRGNSSTPGSWRVTAKNGTTVIEERIGSVWEHRATLDDVFTTDTIMLRGRDSQIRHAIGKGGVAMDITPEHLSLGDGTIPVRLLGTSDHTAPGVAYPFQSPIPPKHAQYEDTANKKSVTKAVRTFKAVFDAFRIFRFYAVADSSAQYRVRVLNPKGVVLYESADDNQWAAKQDLPSVTNKETSVDPGREILVYGAKPFEDITLEVEFTKQVQMFQDGAEPAMFVETNKWNKRQVQVKPQTHSLVDGGKSVFLKDDVNGLLGALPATLLGGESADVEVAPIPAFAPEYGPRAVSTRGGSEPADGSNGIGFARGTASYADHRSIIAIEFFSAVDYKGPLIYEVWESKGKPGDPDYVEMHKLRSTNKFPDGDYKVGDKVVLTFPAPIEVSAGVRYYYKTILANGLPLRVWKGSNGNSYRKMYYRSFERNRLATVNALTLLSRGIGEMLNSISPNNNFLFTENNSLIQWGDISSIEWVRD
ncbi:hypothetical protein F862_gp023 [Vibrio phage vB_VpaS_MAR10]|uniref:Uncharacterized protein n=1 Tax=Vibrio phage vB_VpaS_MAR10 TaxID=1229755 RepID=K7RVI9_9CAUD|nr:hypothetical protein F862_gp023 [Vibrio phage vB_VpaS_MAR10]AFV81255.1 hypothetical protein MAR10_023 [Vibrio phage vB_VpaS_MAR10]